MSDDPFYPSPIVKSQKKYKTKAQSSNLCSTGYNQGWAQEISKAESLFLFHTTQFDHKYLSVPTSCSQSGLADNESSISSIRDKI